MIVRNLYRAPGRRQAIHGGEGQGWNARVFDAADFDTPLKFINYVELEPGASIGVHRHGENEEVYVVLAGRGMMIVNGERCDVGPGDIILNKPGWEHGLENTSAEVLAVLVFEADMIHRGLQSESI